jgi:short-subunit dehydrogenase
MKSYRDKTVWIIGASSGIGHALARELHSRGALLVLSARNEDALQVLNSDLGRQHKVLAFDVGDDAAWTQAFLQLKKIDSTIYLAAAYKPGKIAQIAPEDAANTISINLEGAFRLLRNLLPHYRAQGYGQIALCGSVAGYKGLPGGQPYSATKAAIINLAESLRAETAHENIDVKLICPGFVKTKLTDKNDFSMPMMISAEEASRAIADGLLTEKFEIRFPALFAALMKIVQVLPYKLYFAFARKLNR